MKKIGVFGSAFNPIHIGHLIMSEQARVRLGLDKVLFIPTLNPYHKKVDLINFDLRYKMTENAIKNNKYFQVSSVEKDISGNSYSYNIMQKLIENENAEYYFIMGTDSFNQLDTWYRYTNLLSIVKLIVFKRPGYKVDIDKLEQYKNLTNIYYFDDLQIQISSTFIRNEIKENRYPKYLLLDNTINFIKEYKLW